MKAIKLIALLLFSALAVLSLSSCGGPAEHAAETSNAEGIILSAVANVTQDFLNTLIAFQNATPTPLPSGTATGTPTPIPTIARSPQPDVTPSQTGECNRVAAGVPFDVTIPDDTIMQPGQSFTKTWRLVNNGTCKWTRLYAVVYFSGNPMGAHQTNYLSTEVLPGQSIDVRVEFIAPFEPGTYQSNWMMQSQEGELFGLGPNGDSPFWVRIQVVGPPTSTLTLTPILIESETMTPSATPTPTSSETSIPIATLTPLTSVTFTQTETQNPPHNETSTPTITPLPTGSETVTPTFTPTLTSTPTPALTTPIP